MRLMPCHSRGGIIEDYKKETMVMKDRIDKAGNACVKKGRISYESNNGSLLSYAESAGSGNT
jgi:hypothetical protein